jgi:hypothetical protein
MSYDIRIEGSERMSLGNDTYVPVTFGIGLHTRVLALAAELTVPVRLVGANRSFALRGFIPLGFP